MKLTNAQLMTYFRLCCVSALDSEYQLLKAAVGGFFFFLSPSKTLGVARE